MIAALYCRVSTAEQAQHGYSLEAQEALLRQYATDNNMTVYDLYADRGKSANKALNKRTELLRMLRDAESRKFDCILFKDITRWSRNSAQYYAVQDRLDKSGVYWLAVEQPYLETKTPTGRFQVTVMLGTAQLESENTSQRLKFVISNRIANGGAISGTDKLPLGYKVDNSTGQNRVVKDPDTAPIIMDLFNYYRRTRNQNATLRYAHEQYGLKIWQKVFSSMRRNTMYYGEYRGNPNYCEPYLTKSEWNELHNRHPIYTKRKHNDLYLFRGLLRCPMCGRLMMAQYKSKTCIYYLCQYHQRELGRCDYKTQHRQDKIEMFLLDNLKPILDAAKIESKNIKHDTRNNSKRLQSLQSKLDRIKNLYIDGDLSKDQYTKRRDELRAELSKLEYDNSELDYDRLNAILNSGWKTMYDRIDPADRGHFWRQILNYIEILPDGTYKPWFNGADAFEH